MNWQPIETAPFDTVVLTYDKDGSILWSTQHGKEWVESVFEDDRGPYWTCTDGISEYVEDETTLTHWMPLPEAPK